MPDEKFEITESTEEKIRMIVADELEKQLQQREQKKSPADQETSSVHEGRSEKAHLLSSIQGMLHTLTVKKLEKVLDFIENLEVDP